jgi:hypothetical protein
MAKVITSEGLNEFIESGKHEVIPKAKEPAKEAAKEPPKAEEPKKEEAKAEKVEEKEPPVEADGDLMPEETLEQAKLKIAKKHRELKAEKALRQRLQEERDENERLAESQFNQRRLYESENERLKRELAELQNRAKPVETPALKEPDEGDAQFKDDKGQFDWKKFIKAQADYAVEKFKQEEAQKAEATQRQALQVEVSKRIDAAKAKYPDFVETLEAQADRKDVPPYIMQFMFESEQGAELAYYFAKNREELTKISKLSPIMALARLGKLETRFEPKVEDSPKVEAKVETKVEPVQTSTAPPPITPISGGSTPVNTFDPTKIAPQGDPAAFRALREQHRKEWREKQGKR